ncbi:MAG: VWA domain-containing protein [Oscillibacter sp.]|nr:VWA domain-containing protein [Oscillibacter sp.]
MKTWKRALALVLALVMALSLVALPSFAEGEETGGGNDGMPYIEENGHGGKVEKDGLVMSKTIKKTGDSQFLLTLEAFATGTTTTTTTTDPVDIVLVLDVSGSMDENLMNYTYNSVYNPKTNGRTDYYYQDENGQYQQAYYCDGEYGLRGSHHDAGWYTQDHQSWRGCQGESGRRLTPKTSASDTDTSRTQFYTRTEQDSGTKKIATLKTAVSTFIDSVAEKSPDSSIAIVKFAGNKRDTVGNDTYRNGSYTYNYSQIVQELTPVNTGARSLKTAVNGLIAAGATAADYGMQHAQTIINGAKDDGRQKVVIMFTDGEPNHNTDFDDTVANNAIKASKSIKDDKAIVYTIGCFGGQAGSSDVDTYMNYVSSNYPEATSMTGGGAKADPANYYKTVSSAADLNNIFTDISQTIGGTTVTLGSTSVLRDVISDSFKLPAGADKSSIKAYSVDCLDKNSDGSYSWQDKSAWTAISPENIELTDNNKTINVTGFDYADNWVDQYGVNGSQSHGKKLVVEIPIVPEQDATGSVKTNDDASGIYADSTVKDPVEKFPSPVVYIPYFTVVHVASTVNDQGHNEGKRTGETYHPVWCSRPFNLTSVVTNGYLYGGSFNSVDCTKVQTYAAGENPTDFTPVAGGIYYIWEVPDTYLRPFGYWISRHLEGTLSVTQLYLLAAVDRVNYADAGLKVSFGNGTSQYISSSCEELSNPNTEQLGSATVYQMLETVKGHAGGEVIDTWYLKNGTPVNYEGPLTKSEETGKYLDANDENNSPIDDGCIIGHRLKGGEFESFQKSGVTYRPYWVTLDGVRVEGVRSRNYTFVVGSADPGKPSKDDQLPAVYQYLEKQQSAQTLTLRTNLLAGDTEPAVNDLTVTVIDGSNAPQTIKVAPNGSVRDQVAYQAPAGKVFAGWFTDDSFTTPADLDQVTQDTTIYAKYVSDSYLDLDYSRTGLFRLRGVTLISAVDNPANYQVSGFIVGDQKVDVSYASRYRIFKTPANLFGAARDAKLMLADKSLSGAGDLEVTPYWVTLDGTEVHGVTHTLHYNTRTIWE